MLDIGLKKKLYSYTMQDNKINQRDEQARAQGYWYRTSGEFYYKGNYINNESVGLFEYLFDELGIQTNYYAR
jgi:hypothetical protein